MNVMRFIKNKIHVRTKKTNSSDLQDLILYRRLRHAENKLYDARDCLNRMLASQENMLTENARLTQSSVDPDQQQICDSRHRQLDGHLNELNHKIEFLKNDMNRLETDYQHAQMHVRTHFYQETCSGHQPDSTLPAGHPAQ